MIGLPKWARGTLVWSLPVGALLFVLMQFIVPTVQDYHYTRESIQLKKDLAAKLKSNNLLNSSSEQSSEMARDEIRSTGTLLKATDTSQADAEIRDYFVKTVQATGGKIQSSQSLLFKADGILNGHTLRASFTATLPQLHNLLYKLEAHIPMLFIENIQIQAPQNRRTANTQDQILRIQLNVVGYSTPEDAS